MVRQFVVILISCASSVAYGIFKQTQDDLNYMRDAINGANEADIKWAESLAPMLVAPPRHLWEESKSDFAPAIRHLLQEVWRQPGQLIECPECSTSTSRVSSEQQVSVIDGPLTASELTSLLLNQRYATAKSVVFSQETSMGVEVRIIRISDGAIVYRYLADSTQRIDHTKPRLHIVDEMERRKRGEALAYTFIDLGLWPQSLVHISFFEQWGASNQHLTGVTLSAVNPTAAIGASYRYILPKRTHFQVGLSALFPLQNVVKSDSSAGEFFVALGTIQYAYSPTFGGFATVQSSGQISIGLSFYNPIWFPFML